MNRSPAPTHPATAPAAFDHAYALTVALCGDPQLHHPTLLAVMEALNLLADHRPPTSLPTLPPASPEERFELLNQELTTMVQSAENLGDALLLTRVQALIRSAHASHRS
jgi:hypothetical protein